MKVALKLPETLAEDKVVSRLLQFSINDGERTSQTLGNVLQSDAFEVEEGDRIAGTLTDSDAAGNASEPSSFNFEVDFTAPHQPGKVGLIRLADEPVSTSEAPESTSEEAVSTSEAPAPADEPKDDSDPLSFGNQLLDN